MFLRRENIKRINIFQYFFTCTLKGPFQSSLYLLPRAPTARVRSGFKIKTDSTEFYGVGLDWLLLSSWRKRTCSYFHVYMCVTGKVQTSTSSPEASRPRSVSELRHASFHLLSIVLTYNLNSLFSFFSACPGLIFIGEQWKRKETKRKEVRWSYTHAKIATVNIHTKIALSESAKVDQISSLAFARFCYRNYHTVGKCVGFWEKNACFNLVRARMERLISALRWKLKDSRPRRFLNLPPKFREWFV